ncbi:MAG: restriction endonuclease [Gammaproteobacteria bacterium]|nr:restriction endonuclease [Gammaproteobacteria bacterium]
MARSTPNSHKRLGEIVRGIFKILLDKPDGLHFAKEIFPLLEKEVPPTSSEMEIRENSKFSAYDLNARFHTISCVKAGWLVKDYGHWSLTDAGRDAYREFTDPAEFFRKAMKEYYQWKNSQPPKEVDSVDEVEASDKETSSVTLEMAEEDAWAEVHAHLSVMPPDALEKAVAGLLQGMGHHIESIASGGADGGVDIHAAAGGVAGRRIKVQVKRRQDVIAVDAIRSFRDTLMAGDTGLFVSVGGFTKEAVKEARVGREQLILINGKRFFDLWVSHYERIPEERRQLLPIKRVAFLNLQ